MDRIKGRGRECICFIEKCGRAKKGIQFETRRVLLRETFYTRGGFDGGTRFRKKLDEPMDKMEKIKSKIPTQLLQMHCLDNGKLFTKNFLNVISTISSNVRSFIPHVKTFDVFFQPIYKEKYV